MTGHLSPVKYPGNPIRNERGSSTRLLLLVLLLVVAAAGYLYYFTDLIRPARETAKPVPAQTAQVKQPIPPRPGQQGGEGTNQAKPEAVKPSQGAPVLPPVKQTAEQKAAPAIAPPAKPAEQKPAPGTATQAKPEPAKVAKAAPSPKSAPAPVAPPKPAAPAVKPATPAVKPAVATVKQEPGKIARAGAPPKPAPISKAKKKGAPVKVAAKGKRPVAKRKGGAYALMVGDFVPDKSLEAVQAKLKKNSIAPVRMSAVNAAEPMNRLFVAEFTDQDQAEAELHKLRQLTSDSFMIADDGRYSLYAGSYFTQQRTTSELKRLRAKGIKPVVKKAKVTIKVTRVTAGNYATAEDARDDARRLKKLGITAEIIKLVN